MPSDSLFDQFSVSVNGTELAAEIMNDLDEAVVEDDLAQPAMFTLRFHDPAFTLIDGTQFKLGAEVTISAVTPANQRKVILVGEVTALEPMLSQRITLLVVRGYDLSHRLYRGHQTRTFLKQTDSQIAQKIAQEAGLSADAESTSVSHDYVIQNNESDMDFLRARAARIGFRVRANGKKLVFGRAEQTPPAAPAQTWGQTLLEFRSRMTAVAQSNAVEVRGWDIKTKTALVGKATTAANPSAVLVETGGAAAKKAFSSAATVLVSQQPVATQAEATGMAQAVLNQLAGDYLSAEGACYGEPALKAAEGIGMKTPWPDQNWLSMNDIENLLGLADFEVVRRGTDILLPIHVPLLSDVMNRVAAKLPLVKEGAVVSYFVARPAQVNFLEPLPSVSVVCPCRNEKGNILEAITRTPLMGPRTELIFVDGNSNDGTVEEIQAAIAEYKGPLELSLVLQGDGKGKGDAVRKGYAAARCEVLMILDSDLTVPPEDLPKFYKALVTGKGEFINGVRLVYPMEGQAMRFLNLLGNKFFSLALSWVLEQPIKDSLCGTKVLYRRDYDRIADNRAFFGEFDPFGDFDLLFGAARLNMKIVDLPVRYRARTYGDTKISRFAHGWLLLKMTAFGFKKLRMGL